MNVTEQRAKCFRLRQSGHSLASIARQLNISRRRTKELLTEYDRMKSRGEWAKLLLDKDAIERLALPNRPYNALKRHGVTTITLLKARLNDGTLTEIRGIGIDSETLIRRTLDEHELAEGKVE